MKSAIEEQAFATQRAIESGELVIVGVNRYQSEAAQSAEIHRLDDDLERTQVERLRALRASRDARTCERALAEVRAAARDEGENLLVPMRAALAVRCTIGEVCGVLRSAWGTHDAQHR